jgi:hypothetical protein
MKSQLGFVILLVDGKNNANIVHYASRRSNRFYAAYLQLNFTLLVLVAIIPFAWAKSAQRYWNRSTN